jgi:hypothetical protein
MSRWIKKLDAFDKRGVKLENDRWSWGGYRSDGSLVLQVWADDFRRLPDGTWIVQIGYPSADDASVSDHERSRPGSRERERHIQAIRAGNVPLIELLKGHATDPKASPRQTEGIDSDRFAVAGSIVEIDGAAWIQCLNWQDFRRWPPS